ncbi:MAG TPA: hypothetical protein VNO30_27635 [Kofleriaceae bacterium]|nr:hypothetical protein [Kofleriaceae bacterium]
MADPTSHAPEHAPDPQRQPAPAPAPAPGFEPQPRPRAPRAKPRPAAAAAAGARAPDAAARVDATRTARLLMRAAAGTAGVALAGAALASVGPTRQARLVEAATRATGTFHELAALAALQPIAWRELSAELAALLTAAKQLGGALRAGRIATLADELATGAARLTANIDPRALAAATTASQTAPAPAPAPALAYAERVELARLVIAAAARQAAAARAVNRSTSSAQDEDRAALVQIVQPVAVHLATAVDAALAIPDSRGLEALLADAEALSGELTLLAHRLSHEPRLPWHLAFASVFDAEGQLRATLGLDRKLRPYTGTIDPQAAMSFVGQKARPGPGGGPAAGATQVLAYTDPQAAVSGIAARMDHIFEERIEAVRRLKSDLEEPPPAEEPTLLELLIGLAANVVLSAVSGGLGVLVADKLRASLDRAASSAATALAAKDMAHLSEAARASLVQSMVKDGALRRAVLADAAKDGTKRLFIDSTTRALASTKPLALNAARPLNAFTQHLEHVLRATRYEATILMTYVAGALGQLDLATLDHFAGSLDSVNAAANQIQYDESLREWENVRAHMAAPPLWAISKDDPDLSTRRVNRWAEAPIPGVLEIGVDAGRLFGRIHTAVKYLVLRGGEPAAIRHLKAHPRQLAAAGLNRQYQISLGGDSQALDPDAYRDADTGGLPTFVKVGVGVRQGLQPDSLSHHELRLLKAFSLGSVTWSDLYEAYHSAKYDHVPEAQALAAAQEIIAQVDNVTTARLQG